MPDTPDRNPRRRILRQSVRGLLILVLVIGAWLGWLVRGARIQREAVAAIKNAGGVVSYDRESSDKKAIPEGKPWPPRWLVDLTGVDYFARVTEVSFVSTATDTTIARRKGLSRIGTLNGAPVTDATLAYLNGLTDISALSLRGADITDAGLAQLSGLTKLSDLDLFGTPVSDIGLAHLKGLTNLSSLNLMNTQANDASLAHLRDLPNLSSLNLNMAFVTDAGLSHLKRLKQLTELKIQGTLVTEAGVKDLQHALPKLKIAR